MRHAASLVVAAALAAWPSGLGAGAWLRESGTGFVSASVTMRDAAGRQTAGGAAGGTGREREFALYGEYGARARLTLGLDLNHRAGVSGHALAFLRLPLAGGVSGGGTGGVSGGRTGAGPGRLALELAGGGHHVAGRWQPMARLTLSAGRSFAIGAAGGWINLDAAAEYRHGLGPAFFKLDATAGLSTGPRLRPLLRLETAARPGGRVFWTLTPALMIDGRGGRTWLLGIERKSSPAGGTGIRFELWQRF